MPDNAPVCRRCGRCCELGGPGLLRDDAPLLSSGAASGSGAGRFSPP